MAPDLLNVGKSDKEEPLDYGEHRDTLGELADALGFEGVGFGPARH